ncbi:hypothetical protein AXA44_21870 [Rhodococcus sp. SC4]|nr:hypothetical protein AXA44_21870 [Rhodococcus sp. SC4]
MGPDRTTSSAAPDMAEVVCLVTGAASGIGAASAVRLSAAGAIVVCADLDEAGARHIAEKLVAGGGIAEGIALDVADENSVAGAVDQVVARCGRLDVAVNSAGITAPPRTGIVETTANQWRSVLDVNLTGVFLCMRSEIAAMSRDGGGAIVNLASVLGLVGRAEQAAYVASKHGVIGLTRAAAIECADRKIRVNAVCPGYIETPMIDQMPSEGRALITARHPVRRLGTAEEVAEVVAFLASDRAQFVTGAQYAVDGGYTAM